MDVRQIFREFGLSPLEVVIVEMDATLRDWRKRAIHPSPEPPTEANVRRWANDLSEAMETAIGEIHMKHPTLTAHDMLALIREAVLEVLDDYQDRDFLQAVYGVPAAEARPVIWHQNAAIREIEQLSLW
jgi:hypothetical protein